MCVRDDLLKTSLNDSEERRCGMDKSLDLISSYAASLSYKDLSLEAIHAAKQKFIDTMGCALCVYLWEPSKRVRSLCLPMDSGLTARPLGSSIRTTPEMAAFVNSTMVRTADYSDVYGSKRVTHPSDCIAGPLAMAEALHADGKSLLTAIVLGYEMGVSFSEKVGTMKHWNPDPCALAAVLGSAMGAGKILGLTKAEMANCAALAIVPNINLGARLTGEHSMFKEVYAGMAARQGVFAATMAKAGITGPEKAIEGENGLNTLVDSTHFGPLGTKGTGFAVERPILKEYPARGNLQWAIEAAVKLHEKVVPDEIASVRVWVTKGVADTAANSPEVWAPKAAETADHSLPFCVAAAFVDGGVTIESYSNRRFLNKDLLDFIKKIKVDKDPEFTKAMPNFNARIEVKTKRGETHVHHESTTLDEVREKWTNEKVEAKFRRLVRFILTPAQIEASLELMWNLEKVGDVTQMIDHFQV
jgi:2-methylcitrate dehydratase